MSDLEVCPGSSRRLAGDPGSESRVPVIAAIRRGGARFSVTVSMYAEVKTATARDPSRWIQANEGVNGTANRALSHISWLLRGLVRRGGRVYGGGGSRRGRRSGVRLPGRCAPLPDSGRSRHRVLFAVISTVNSTRSLVWDGKTQVQVQA